MADLTDEQINAAYAALVEQHTGRDMAYHQRNKTTGLDFARRAFEAGASFAKPAEGGVVEALISALEELAAAGEEAWGADRPCVREARMALALARERGA